MVDVIVVLIARSIRWIQPFLGPICFIAAWMMLMMVGWSLWSFVRDSIQRTQKMHQIPCATCRYFTGDYHLKCPVKPSMALSEAAINCTDYERSPGFYS